MIKRKLPRLMNNKLVHCRKPRLYRESYIANRLYSDLMPSLLSNVIQWSCRAYRSSLYFHIIRYEILGNIIRYENLLFGNNYFLLYINLYIQSRRKRIKKSITQYIILENLQMLNRWYASPLNSKIIDLYEKIKVESKTECLYISKGK